MKHRAHKTIAQLVLVLGVAGFAARGENAERGGAAKEQALLAAVSATGSKSSDLRAAKAYEDLADYYTAERRYADAEAPYQKALEIKEDALGRANPAIIPAVDDLARVNFAQMKYDEAADLIGRELRIMEREYGDNDARLAPYLEQVARVSEAAVKHGDAQRFLERAIAIREKGAGRESAELAPDLNQLAHVKAAAHDPAAAEALYRRALGIERSKLAANSPELLPTLDALAALAMEQHQDAEPLLKQALAIRESSLGPNDVEVAKNLDELAAWDAGEKRMEDARKARERALFIWMKELKPGSPELAEKYEKMAELYEALNRPADAEPLVRQVVTARESETVASLNTLAAIYVSQQNLGGAESLYKLSLAILDKKGVLSSKRPPALAGEDENVDLLAETALNYADLLKKMRRKSDANKIEARVRAMTGKGFTAKKKAT